MICLFHPFFHLNLYAFLALNMTKRDSSTANLASPRDLRMDSWLSPMSTNRHRPSTGAASSSGPGWPLSGSYAAPKAAAISTYGYTEFESDLCLVVMTRGTHFRTILSTVRCIKIKGCCIPKRSSNWRSGKDPTNKNSDGLQKPMRRHREITTPGFFLPWNCWSCEGQVGLSNQWMERSITLSKLLAQILRH